MQTNHSPRADRFNRRHVDGNNRHQDTDTNRNDAGFAGVPVTGRRHDEKNSTGSKNHYGYLRSVREANASLSGEGHQRENDYRLQPTLPATL